MKAAAAAQQLSLLPAPALAILDRRLRGTSFHQLPIRSVLNSPESTGMGFWSLNPYVGCEFGCSYCYARDTHRWAVERLEAELGSLPPADAFERRILVKTEVAHVLRRTLNPAKVGAATIVIGTATDPYQPAEQRFGLTRRVLETLLAYRGLTIGIITKSALVARDADLLARLARRHDLSVNLSLATMDAELLRRLEPRTPLPHARLRALRILADAGVEAAVLLAPILPGITDDWAGLAKVMEAARAAGARDVVGFPLRLGPAARARFVPLLEREFPALAPRYEAHYQGRTNPSRAYARALARRIRLLREAYGFPARERPRGKSAVQPPSESGGLTMSSSGGAVSTR